MDVSCIVDTVGALHCIVDATFISVVFLVVLEFEEVKMFLEQFVVSLLLEHFVVVDPDPIVWQPFLFETL